MSKYVDVYLLPIAEENVLKYKKMATAAGKLFRKHGAITYREYVVSDLKVEGGIMAFDKAIKLKPGETLIYAEVGFKSEAHRNKAMKAIFGDPEMGVGMEEMDSKNPIFNMKRMVYGGFKILVDV